jgi:hypothetical protein
MCRTTLPVSSGISRSHAKTMPPIRLPNLNHNLWPPTIRWANNFREDELRVLIGPMASAKGLSGQTTLPPEVAGIVGLSGNSRMVVGQY